MGGGASTNDTNALYSYDYTILPPVAFSKGIKPSDYPSVEWVIKVFHVHVKIAGNAKIVDIINSIQKEDHSFGQFLHEIYDSKFLLHLGETKKESLVDAPLLSKEVTSIDQYKEIFNDKTCILPACADFFDDDAYFAFMRLGGFNPVMIERVTSTLPNTFKLTQEIFQKAPGFENDQLTDAIADGRLYITDYKSLEIMKPGDKPVPKAVFCPIGLFGVPKEGKTLLPIAVQSHQTPDSVIATPVDGEMWQKMRHVFNCAEANMHQLVTHFSRTHLLLEPFVVAVGNLPEDHPIKRILHPHLEGTAFINFMAVKTLVSPGGGVEELLMGTLTSDLELAAHWLQSPGFNGLMLRPFLAARGTLTAPIDYPYRDDALKLWDATHCWMTAYVDSHYPSDSSITSDAVLQAFTATLASAGRLNNFGECEGEVCVPGKVTTRKYLAEVLTMVAFTAGCQHAAVNFTQKDLMSFAPTVPLAIYADPKDPAVTALQLVPPLDQALLQQRVLTVLGSVHHTLYGEYNLHKLKLKDELKDHLEVFQLRLKEIEKEIHLRNSTCEEGFKYEALLPSLIPQSINV
mmetsp:Transcript_30208/g.41556  ORF Transcript_30208/g.41556 Transcript_30208/m.41556 type:complete len:573 (-) Transcript_30208:166-1884(-)